MSTKIFMTPEFKHDLSTNKVIYGFWMFYSVTHNETFEEFKSKTVRDYYYQEMTYGNVAAVLAHDNRLLQIDLGDYRPMSALSYAICYSTEQLYDDDTAALKYIKRYYQEGNKDKVVNHPILKIAFYCIAGSASGNLNLVDKVRNALYVDISSEYTRARFDTTGSNNIKTHEHLLNTITNLEPFIKVTDFPLLNEATVGSHYCKPTTISGQYVVRKCMLDGFGKKYYLEEGNNLYIDFTDDTIVLQLPPINTTVVRNSGSTSNTAYGSQWLNALTSKYRLMDKADGVSVSDKFDTRTNNFNYIIGSSGTDSLLFTYDNETDPNRYLTSKLSTYRSALNSNEQYYTDSLKVKLLGFNLFSKDNDVNYVYVTDDSGKTYKLLVSELKAYINRE